MATIRSVIDGLTSALFGPAGRRRRNSHRNPVVSADVLEPRVVPTHLVWTGGSLLNDKWSDPKNWDGEITPQSGDSVEFGHLAGRFDRAPINDISGLKLSSIHFTSGGYTLKGNAVELSFGVITEFSQEAIDHNDPLTANVIDQDITIPSNGTKLTFDVGDSNVLHIAGRVTGPATAEVTATTSRSNPFKIPVLFFTGNKNNSFGRFVDTGIQVGLSRTAGAITIPGDLQINSAGDTLDAAVFINQSEQIRDTANIQLRGKSRIQFGENVSETINSLTFVAPASTGTRISGNGNLTVRSSITAVPDSVGDTENKTVTIDTKSLNRTGAGVLTFDVALHRRLNVLAAVKGNTGIRKTGTGMLNFGGTTANTYSGVTFVDAGIMSFSKQSQVIALPGTMEIGSATSAQPEPNQAPTVKAVLDGNEIVSNVAVIKVHPNGLLEADGAFRASKDEVFGELILNGGRVSTFSHLSPKRITVQPSGFGSLILGGLNLPPAVFGVSTTVQYDVADGAANIDVNVARTTGDGAWTKRGLGTMQSLLSNTAIQAVSVAEGTLELKDLGPATIVTVLATANLKGDAVIGGLAVKGEGRVDSSQLLTVFGTVEFSPFSIQQMKPLPSTVDEMRLATTGNVILGDSAAQAFPVLDVQPQGAIPLGRKLTVIRVGSGKTLTGKFTAPGQLNGGPVLNEGSTFTAGGQNFTISYIGGTSGKDVVITRNTGPAFVNRSLPQTANEGDQVTLRGQITEPDAGDSFKLTVNWGDGQTETFDFAAGADRNVLLNHKYEQDGVYHVHLDWRDQHGGGNTGDHQIRIRNQRPVLQDVAVTSPVVRNATATLFGRVSDVGSKDTLRVTVRWGDGSASETLTVTPSGEIQANHHFRRPGRYRLTLEASDGSAVTTTRVWLRVL
ncbi:MAG: PKD domain-containing protein [Planctomycetaceae bacterium]